MDTNINIIDIKNKITNIEYFCLRKNDTFECGFEPLKAFIHQDIFDDIKRNYFTQLENIMKDSDFEEFSYDVTPDDTISILPISSINGSKIKDILLDTISSIDNINTIDKFTKTLSESYLYGFIFTLEENKKFTIIRKVFSYNYLKNKGILSYKDSRLNFIVEDLFALDSKIDCFIYNNFIYILSKHNFETLFSYKSHYIDKANISLTSINDSDIIENFEEFKEDCICRSTITRKLAELSTNEDIRSFINKIKTSPDVIEETIKKYNLDITIKNNKIIYEDVSSLSEIINLISENYFEGNFTQDKYVAKGKNRLAKSRKNKAQNSKKHRKSKK